MSSPDGPGASASVSPTLRRDLGLFELPVYGVGLILGAGIYAVLGEAAGVVIVIWLGRQTWGGVDLLDAPLGVPGVVEGAFLAFFAYLGFGSIVNVAEETEDPTETIPRAILLAIGVTTVFYVLVALSAVGAASSTSRSTSSRSRASAGTTSPLVSSITSPGTSSVASTSTVVPSRPV